MMWQPTKAQMETIVDMSVARMPIEAIARAVGVPADDFVAWAPKILRRSMLTLPHRLRGHCHNRRHHRRKRD